MITILFVLFCAPTAQAADGALMLNLGLWSTDKSFCGSAAQCVGIKNSSYTECVAFGFAEGGTELQLGNTVVLRGGTTQTSVWVADGPDRDLNLDPEACIPPRETVWGPVPSDWTWVHVQSIKYYVGDIREVPADKLSYPVTLPSPLPRGKALSGQFYGQYYAGTGQGLPNRSRPGSSPNAYNLNKTLLLEVGGS